MGLQYFMFCSGYLIGLRISRFKVSIRFRVHSTTSYNVLKNYRSMFSRPERLRQRTPKNGVGRFEYLQQLVKEFHTTNSITSKEQILANLANFAYDPINYEFLRTLLVIDLFLDQLSHSNLKFVQFSIGGLCNLSADPENQEYIIKSGGVNHIATCLHSSDQQTVLSAIATFIFLISPVNKHDILKEDIIEKIKELSNSSDRRFQNLAIVFLRSYESSNAENEQS